MFSPWGWDGFGTQALPIIISRKPLWLKAGVSSQGTYRVSQQPLFNLVHRSNLAIVTLLRTSVQICVPDFVRCKPQVLPNLKNSPFEARKPPQNETVEPLLRGILIPILEV